MLRARGRQASPRRTAHFEPLLLTELQVRMRTMAQLSGNLVHPSAPTEQSYFHLDFAVPTFRYDADTSVEAGDGERARHRIRVSLSNQRTAVADDGSYTTAIPDEAILGPDIRAFAQWVEHVSLWEMCFPLDVMVSESGIPVGDHTFEVLYFAQGPALQTHGLRLVTAKLFLVNAEVLRRVLGEVGQRDDEKHELNVLAALAALTVEVGGRLSPREVTDDAVIEVGRRFGLRPDMVASLHKNIEALTAFDVPVPEREPLRLAGTFTITDETEVDARQLAFFHPVVDVPVLTLSGTVLRSFTPRWPAVSGTASLPLDFEWELDPPVSLSTIVGPVTVRVKGFDGSILWQEAHPAGSEDLTGLVIEVKNHRPRTITRPVTTAEDTSSRRIRGQVVAMDPKQRVDSLTVVVQARSASDINWRLVSSGKTDGSGYFTLPYPAGEFIAAQALVSVAPNSPTDIGITAPQPDGSTLADDFVHLLISVEAAPPAEDCGCARHVGRLPDQADLIRSGEYTQDLGGGCINVSTPNRTLREYDFTAIVRATDPDVASYTLTRRADGTFDLIGGTSKIDRRPVELDNPIRWQDSPSTGDSLNFYQAVTVATGHVLHFKAAFKADGYSLGELVYSLPLAPGQKKQVVAFDMANTLEATETQRLRQGERLAADLFDDRTITNGLSGALSESLAGSSRANTSGMSAGLGAAGTIGAISGSLGVAGGFSNSDSSASQNGARGISQYFGERLRQTLSQNAEAYRELNASVVTTVRDGQEYSVETEVVANHNHCHSMTMMYFEVLRHYAITQELSDVSECVFVPLLLTEFTAGKVSRWKDVLSANLLPVPAATYLQPFPFRLARLPGHPLLKAFDALDRWQTDWSRVDYPVASYAEDAITSISGDFKVRVNLPRPPTRFDRIASLPLTTETRTSKRTDVEATIADAIFTGGLSLLGGVSTENVSETVIVRQRIFDAFMELDANYQTVRPADCIRVKTFSDQTISLPGGTSVTLTFFQNAQDRQQWASYATLLEDPGITSPESLLQQYFAGKLISEWNGIFNRDLAPLLFSKLLDSVGISPLSLDLTPTSRYNGGERTISVRVSGGAHAARNTLPDRMRLHSSSVPAHAVRSFTTLIVENVNLRYQTAHFDGVLHQGFAGGDLLDADFATSGVQLNTPLTSQDRRNPRKEDRFLAEELIAHLNTHLEHYNKALWRGLDEDRRFMLLDGFSIQTYDDDGLPVGMRALASVVKHQLLDIAGNALVFPVADGFRVSQSLIIERESPVSASDLRDQYEPESAVPPYRLSVPTRGVYMEAVMGQCDACEMVKPNSSQDWDRFRADEPTAINAVTTPTPQRVDWRAVWAQFASPLVAMQVAREAPAPGAGLAGLSDALTKAGSFADVTGLAANQSNAMQTFLSNQENAKAFASMAQTMAMQQHNSENSGDIMRTLEQARSGGAVSEADYQQLVRDHLGQQIDGGSRRSAEARAQEVRQPSLTKAAIEAVGEGHSVTAHSTRPDGTRESVEVRPTGEPPMEAVHYDVPLVPQPNKTACWAASMAMIESYRRSRERQQSVTVSAAELAEEVGYPLEQSYGWDRLESVKDFYDFDEIPLTGTQYPSATQWRSWLAAHGPLYVTVGGEPSHAIVVHGISGDATPDGSRLEILDAWDINTAFDDDPTQFNPPNTGARLTLTVTELNGRFNEGGLSTLALYENWRILYQPTNSPTATIAPSGAGNTRVFRIRALNRLLPSDPDIAAKMTVSSAAFSRDQVLRGPKWHPVKTTIPDGTYTLIIVPDSAAAVPADWPSFARPPATGSQASRVWIEERATITVARGRVTQVTGNPNITLSGDSVTVGLRPLWAHTPYRQPRAAPPTSIVVHHTGPGGPLPSGFILGPEKRSAHYVITPDGTIVKLADERTEIAFHAGDSAWRGTASLNDVSVGIEVVHVSGPYPAVQIQSLTTLLEQLRGAFAGIKVRDVIAHSDCGTDSGVLGRKLSDPGRTMDWPAIETAGHAVAPASDAATFTSPVADIYHKFFASNAGRRMTPRASTVTPLPAAVAAAHRELKEDLHTIGYAIPAHDRTSAEYTNSTARAVACFMDRYFSGGRVRPDAEYSWNVDFLTAQMIKKVLKTVTTP
ncbi:N-acetylmuramoyl-L-alanine amidase [Streptosporangium sp. NPDC006013]|uniref:N-acetylmuramoyl-L-alanine amidase n=1 Tax=Streptosporangium sp. NPDC006013 TaxID=3155596 RepID=UPI0033B3A937